MATPLWRMMLLPASYNGAPFHVDANSRTSGRRVVLHEFPKRDTPYAEDMGRKARTFPVTGYVIGPDYQIQRERLINALETEGPGLLILPTRLQRDTVLVQPREYTVRETRQAGGMAEFDMQFVEAGEAGFSSNSGSQQQANAAADDTEGQTVNASGDELAPGDTGNSFGAGGSEDAVFADTAPGAGTGGTGGGTVTIGEPEIGVGTPFDPGAVVP
jgi:prophage DNA circulation protein